MEFIVYILYSEKFDKYYIGQTNALSIRFRQHNEARKSYTSKYRPWILAHQESCETRSIALRLEKYLKSFKNKATLKKYIDSKQNIAG